MRTFCLAVLALGVLAQSPENLLFNGDASRGAVGWQPLGQATIEGTGKDAHFVVRNQGRFQQLVPLPASAAGQFVVYVARGSTERINADGAITGLPYLYGMLIADDGGKILAYLQGQNMRLRPVARDTWAIMSGVFRVPEGARRLLFQLGQAERKDVPQNGSAARFDDVGLFIFPSEEQGRALIADWPTPAPSYPPPPNVIPSPPRPAEPREPLAAPANPSAVVPFNSDWGVVLPVDEGVKSARQCSRPSPGPIQDVWLPDRETIAKLEAALAPLVQGALERSPRATARTLSSGDYYRQYAGIVVGGNRLVYVNGFHRRAALTPAWRTSMQLACDGGELFFGAEFDPATGQVLSLAFNGPR